MEVKKIRTQEKHLSKILDIFEQALKKTQKKLNRLLVLLNSFLNKFPIGVEEVEIQKKLKIEEWLKTRLYSIIDNFDDLEKDIFDESMKRGLKINYKIMDIFHGKLERKYLEISKNDGIQAYLRFMFSEKDLRERNEKFKKYENILYFDGVDVMTEIENYHMKQPPKSMNFSFFNLGEKNVNLQEESFYKARAPMGGINGLQLSLGYEKGKNIF